MQSLFDHIHQGSIVLLSWAMTAGDGFTGDSGDALYDQALAIILRERKVSTSFLQRHLQVGYNRAAHIIEKLEEEGVISQPNHAGKREILGI